MSVLDYDSENEVNGVNEHDSVNISVLLNNPSSTTRLHFGDFNKTSPQIHIHKSTCYTTEVFVKGINFLFNKRIKKEPDNKLGKNFFNHISIDDGFQEGSPSLFDLSESNEFDHSAWSDGHKKFQGLVEKNYQINEKLCSNNSCLKKLTSSTMQCKLLPKFNDRFYKSFEYLVQDFEDKFNSDALSSFRSYVLYMNKLDVKHARYELHNIFHSIFNDKIDWGRIVAMIGFVCEMSWSAFLNHRQELINEYIIISVDFVDRNLWSWISQHGGWEGLVEFQLGHNNQNEFENVFGNLTKIARVAVLALAGVLFCKYVADHI